MNALDLFSGIGCFSLGLERAGVRTDQFCEFDAYRRAIIAKHWPAVPCAGDVRELHAGAGQYRVIAGGPPCQRTSLAAAIQGKRTGETLWPEMARLVGEGRPEWVIVEQPPGNSRWEAQVAADLEGLGYHSSRFERSASDSGAPHRRRRLFIVANALHERCDQVARLAGAPEAAQRDPWPAPPRGTWRTPGAGNTGMDDGTADWVHRIAALGDTVFPADAEAIGRAIMRVAA